MSDNYRVALFAAETERFLSGTNDVLSCVLITL